MVCKILKSDLTTELADVSFHNVVELSNCRGKYGAVCERTSGHFLVDDGNDVEVGNSKRIVVGKSKGQKRNRTVKDRLALSHEQTENKT